MVSFNELRALIDAGNVKTILGHFKDAGCWNTKEDVVCAFQTMVLQEKHTFDRTEMIYALKSVEKICSSESGGVPKKP